VPVVLCYLEGHTNEEAARQLGCPRGTILSRLARARDRLRVRLARRGLALSAAGVGAILTGNASAAPALPLVSSTVRAAAHVAAGKAVGALSAPVAALAEGVLRAMLLSKLKVVVAAVLLVGLVAAGTGWLGQSALVGRAAAQARGRPEAAGRDGRGIATVRGVIKAVDAGKATLTVTLPVRGRDEAAPEETYTLAKNVEVLRGDLGNRGFTAMEEGKLADLAAGDVVTLVLAADGKTVEALAAEGPTLQGLLKSVDAAKRTLTLEQGSRGRGADTAEEKTFTVAAQAEVVIDDGRGRRWSLHEGKLADLSAGALVSVRLSLDQKQVELIMAQGPMMRGTLKAVDAGKREVTIAVPTGDRDGGMEERTYTVAEGAAVLADVGSSRFLSMRARKLADLPAGSQVTVKLAVDGQSVRAIQAEGPTVIGTVKAVDAGKRTITVTVGATRTEAGEDRTFAVAASATIHVDGAERQLADVPAGDGNMRVALRLSLDQKTVQVIQAGGGRR
jgi:hypothetical protein